MFHSHFFRAVSRNRQCPHSNRQNETETKNYSRFRNRNTLLSILVLPYSMISSHFAHILYIFIFHPVLGLLPIEQKSACGFSLATVDMMKIGLER